MGKLSTLDLQKSAVGVHLAKFIHFLKNFKPWRKPEFWSRLGTFLLVFIILTGGGMTLYVSSLDISKLQTPLAHPSFLTIKKITGFPNFHPRELSPFLGNKSLLL